MVRLSLQAKIAALSEELYRGEWEEVLPAIQELAVAVKRRRRSRAEVAEEFLRVAKKAMIRALMEGNERAFYQISKIKKDVEGLLRERPSPSIFKS